MEDIEIIIKGLNRPGTVRRSRVFGAIANAMDDLCEEKALDEKDLRRAKIIQGKCYEKYVIHDESERVSRNKQTNVRRKATREKSG